MLYIFKKFDDLDWVVLDENKIPKGVFIVASKHQSVWDTIFFTAYFNDAAMVLKKILIYIPANGWHALKAKMIWIDRKGKGKALRHLLNKAEEAKKIGRPIIIFPEGTRVKVGEKTELKSGCYALYKYLKIPCVPVALNSGLFWKTKGYRKNKGIIKVRFLEEIKPGMSKNEFNKILRDRIESATKELVENE